MSEPYYDDGQVQIWHGDCRDLRDLATDVIITDPPYAVRYARPVTCSSCGNTDALPARWVCSDCLADGDAPRSEFEMLGYVAPNWEEKGTHTRGYYDHDPIAYRHLISEAFTAAISGLRAGGLVAAFGGTRTYHQLASTLEGLGLEVIDLLTWVHDSADFSRAPSMLLNQHEPMVLARDPSGPKRPVTGDNVVRFQRRTDKTGHPTPKPREVMQTLVERLTEPDQTILDPFAGGGSTLVAAKAMGRRAIGVEIEERWCEVAANRCAQGVLAF